MEITQCNAYGMDIKATINDKDPSNMFAGDMPKKKKREKKELKWKVQQFHCWKHASAFNIEIRKTC